MSFIETNVKKNLDKFSGDISLLDKHIENEVENYSSIFEDALKVINKNNGFQPISTSYPADNAATPHNDKYTL